MPDSSWAERGYGGRGRRRQHRSSRDPGTRAQKMDHEGARVRPTFANDLTGMLRQNIPMNHHPSVRHMTWTEPQGVPQGARTIPLSCLHGGVPERHSRPAWSWTGVTFRSRKRDDPGSAGRHSRTWPGRTRRSRFGESSEAPDASVQPPRQTRSVTLRERSSGRTTTPGGPPIRPPSVRSCQHSGMPPSRRAPTISQRNMPVIDWSSDVSAMAQRARANMADGPITGIYGRT